MSRTYRDSRKWKYKHTWVWGDSIRFLDWINQLKKYDRDWGYYKRYMKNPMWWNHMYSVVPTRRITRDYLKTLIGRVDRRPWIFTIKPDKFSLPSTFIVEYPTDYVDDVILPDYKKPTVYYW